MTVELVLPARAPEPHWVEAIAVLELPTERAYRAPGSVYDSVVSLDWDDGHVELRTVRAEPGVVGIRVPGYQLVTSQVDPGGGEHVDVGQVPLVPSRVLEGSVRTKDGRPIEGARLQMRPSPPDLASTVLRPTLARSSSDGSFRLELPFGAGDIAFQVHVEADGYVGTRAYVREERGRATEPVDFELYRGFIVRGTVLDEKRRPVAGAFVGRSASDATFADSRGDFALRVGSLPTKLFATIVPDDELNGPGTYAYTPPTVRRLFRGETVPGMWSGTTTVPKSIADPAPVEIVLRQAE